MPLSTEGLDVLVCIKQVPDVTEMKIDPETHTLLREGVPSIVNPFDEHAVEAAVRIREALGGKVTVISMGPPQAEEALRQCLQMGADEAFLISDRALVGSDTIATSYCLSRAIATIGKCDLILCGQQAIDGDTAQVGPGIAENLSLPQVTCVSSIEVQDNRKKAIVRREIEGGYEVVECSLPAVFTVTKSINSPRPPATEIRGRQVRRLGVLDINCDPERIGLKGSKTWVMDMFPPKPNRRGVNAIESTLPAAERIRLLISGGLRERKGDILTGCSLEQVAAQWVNHLANWGLSRVGTP